jgi:hypothetical protein
LPLAALSQLEHTALSHRRIAASALRAPTNTVPRAGKVQPWLMRKKTLLLFY